MKRLSIFHLFTLVLVIMAQPLTIRANDSNNAGDQQANTHNRQIMVSDVSWQELPDDHADQNDTAQQELRNKITALVMQLLLEQEKKHKTMLPIYSHPKTDLNKLDSDTTVVLTNFSEIVNKFFNIVKNPDDKQNIANNITGILAHIVSIALQATKHKAIVE